MDKYFQSYTPRVKVVKRDLISNDESYSLLSDEIISITTNKAYGRCSGTWQMILPYYSRWYVDNDGKPIIWSNVLEPDHLLIIEMDAGDGSGLKNVMYGLIDRVSTVRQGGIQPQRTVKISGRDLGKLMEKYDVTYDALKIQEEFVKKQDSSPPQKEQTRVRILDPKLMIGTSDEIIGHAFVYFWENMDYGHRFSFVSDTDDTWKILQPNMVQQLHTSFWQYISQADNRPYNMLHNDVDPDVQGQQLLVLEKNPLDDKGELTRDADRSAAIDDTEIISDDLGISDAERVNLLALVMGLYQTSPDMAKDAYILGVGEYDMDSVKRHGLCLHTVRSEIWSPDDVKSNIDKNITQQSLNQRQERQKLYWNWYKDNHKYWSGTIVTHLRPDIRAGFQLLVMIGDTGEFRSYLVEQVAHQCNFHPTPSFTTTLHVTRGQKATPDQKSIAVSKMVQAADKDKTA